MSNQYVDNYQGQYRHNLATPPENSVNASNRRNLRSTSRDPFFQSTFQPNRNRMDPVYHRQDHPNEGYSYSNRYNQPVASSHQTNTSSNYRPHPRYQLETSSNTSHGRSYRSHQDDQQNRFRSLDRAHPSNQQSTVNHSSRPTIIRYEETPRRHERDFDGNSRRRDRHDTDQLSPNNRIPEHLSSRVNRNTFRSTDHSTGFSVTNPRTSRHANTSPQSLVQPSSPTYNHHPTSLVTNFIQSFFDGLNPLTDGNHHSAVPSMDLLGFAWMMQRPDILSIPGAIHIHFGDLSELLAHSEAPQVGLSDDEIGRIPTMTYRKSRTQKANDDNCVICLSEYKNGDSIKRLKCQHIFHSECIDPWFKTSTQCPICRQTQADK